MFKAAGTGLYLFNTAIGPVALAWTPQGVAHLEIGHASADDARAAIASKHAPTTTPRPLPLAVKATARRLKAQLRGAPDTLADIPVDLSGCTPFARSVLRQLRRVPPGKCITYGELARRCRHPGAARAVGRIMGANPVPIIVPCHRCLGADGSLTGFSATGGTRLKARLLHNEGYVRHPEHDAGVKHLLRVEPRFAPIVKKIGPYMAILDKPEPPYDTLVRAIVHQQLSLKAGQTIAGRVAALTPGPGFPTPTEMLTFDFERLRKCGLSKAKMAYLCDLAANINNHVIILKGLRHKSDSEVIAALTAIKGIGVWTAHMFLIFQLGRLDVLPVGDLGIRAGAARLFGLGEKPTPAELTAMTEPWRPYRSIGSWYLWESLESM